MECQCSICKNNKVFNMPHEILEAITKNDLVLFCGAGISTENKAVLPESLYSEIKAELGIDENLNFSKLMSIYCSKPNGRKNLIIKIKERFDYIKSFPELESRATRFHRELAQLYMIKTIITTNWDDYFEKYSSAIPITTIEDFAFWDIYDRQVLKIHGSINNIGSIIATEEDYKKCLKDLSKNNIGSILKVLLSTKTIVFIGFSFGDEDFNQILNYVRKEMKDYMPHIYVITLDHNLSKNLNYSNITQITTDGTFFINQLKEHLKNDGYIIDTPIYHFANYKYSQIQQEHHELSEKIDYKKFPEIIYSLAYQDGILHAFERLMEMDSTGKYYDPIYLNNSIETYKKHVEKYNYECEYWDLSYVKGYLTALSYINSKIKLDFIIPMYYLPNVDESIMTYDDLLKQINSNINENNILKNYAKNLTKDKYTDIILHHPPLLVED